MSASWTSLEIAKLAVAALTPVLVVVLGVVLGVMVGRFTRRIEQAQWASRKLIEKRLDLFDEMAGPLNDLLCFFRLIGDFQRISPLDAIAHKRRLDKLFYTHEALMSIDFGVRYHAFINACFLPYASPGHDAQLKASLQRQKKVRGEGWHPDWEVCFVSQEASVTSLADLGHKYRDLMACFAEQVGARTSDATARRKGKAAPSR